MEIVNIGPLKAYAQKAINLGAPLIVFLHGQGERGTDLNLVLKYGPLAIVKAGDILPSLLSSANILHPQLPKTFTKWNVDQILSVIDYAVRNYNVDTTRIYLLGVSLGGFGVWEFLATSHAKYLAAAVLMSPGVGPQGKEKAIALNDVPIWVAHAKDDPLAAAKFETSRLAVERINAYAGKHLAMLTSFGLSAHTTSGAWGRFMQPNNFYLWEWLRYQVRRNEPELEKAIKTIAEIKNQIMLYESL